MRSDDYVDGTIACGILSAKFYRDVWAMVYYFSQENRPNLPDFDLENLLYYEEAFFNVTGELT